MSVADPGTSVPGVPDPTNPPAPTVTVPPAAPAAPGTPGAPPAAPAPRTYTEDELNAERERIRKEEKDKLYPQLKTKDDLEKEIARMRGEQEAREKSAAEAQKAAEAEAKKKAEEEMSAKQLIESRTADFEKRQAELQEQLAEAERQRTFDMAVLEKERQYSEVLAYKTGRIQAEHENIHPAFVDYIGGNSKEEVDASIQTAIAKTQALTAEVGEVVTGVRQATPTAPATGAPGQPVTGPLEGGGKKEFTLDEFKGMSLEEYAKYRDRLGVTRGNTGGGMFR